MSRFLAVSILLVWASLHYAVPQPQVITEIILPDDVHTSFVEANADKEGHLGCFKDTGIRDLPHQAYAAANSPQLCKEACQKLGFRFAGVQQSNQCFCGNSFGKYGKADNCNMQCHGHNDRICGGSLANNVYAVPGFVEPVAEGPLEHYGCFKDTTHRDLPHFAYGGLGVNSPQLCKEACQKLGFRFAGVQQSRYCFCGNTFNRYGRADNCNILCDRHNDQICGGFYANNIYNAGGYKEPKPEGALEFFGCFRDDTDKDLPQLGYAYTDENSIEKCKAACQSLGFRFAGVQFSRRCFCGNSFGRYGRSNECDMRCRGNNAQVCGGSMANSIYSAAYVKRSFSYRGCYKDTGDRDLPRTAYSGSNSIEQCVSACTGLGFKFAGLQASTHCLCGNSFGRFGRADNCNLGCSGNNAQVCGGYWANSIYRIIA